jgi:hypothetical protein
MDVDVVILIFGSEADELLDTPTMALSSSSSSSMFLFAIHSPLVFLNGTALADSFCPIFFSFTCDL